MHFWDYSRFISVCFINTRYNNDIDKRTLYYTSHYVIYALQLQYSDDKLSWVFINFYSWKTWKIHRRYNPSLKQWQVLHNSLTTRFLGPYKNV